MNHRTLTMLLTFLMLVGVLQAQKATAGSLDEKEPKKQEKDKEPTPPKDDAKDPTAPSPKLKELMNPPAKLGAAAVTKIALMSLRGRVIGKNQPPLALLEVDGKVYVIGKGSSLPAGSNTTLRVIDITSWEVRIEVMPMKELVILR